MTPLSVLLLLIFGVTAWSTDLDDLARLLVQQPLIRAFGVKDDHGISMDCLQTIPADATDGHLYGFYHHDASNKWDIYLAESTNGLQGPWTRRQTLVHDSGSMPYIYLHPDTGTYILAYEVIASGGNYPVFNFYKNTADLLNAHLMYSTTLMKRVHIAAPGNTYTADFSDDIKNIGTPTITAVQLLDKVWTLSVRFHFTTTSSGELDTPGYGVITFNPTKEVGLYFNWQGYFDNDVNNAIQVARDVHGGKIGQRANIHFRGRLYYLYEAQLTSSFNWADWRLFLYSSDENRAVKLALSIDGIVDFANPSVTQLGNSTVVTLFVPSEAVNSNTPSQDSPGCLVYTLPPLK